MTTLENRPAGLLTFDFVKDRLSVKFYTRSVNWRVNGFERNALRFLHVFRKH
jgi:hypothetical protein